LGRAKTLLEGLGGEKDRWQEAAKQLAISQDSLTGDCLIASANIAFLGPYTGDYRASQIN
jgi:dynein heavy chain